MPTTQEVLSTVPGTYLEKPITLEVDIAPVSKWHAFLQRRGWSLIKQRYEIRPIYLGSLVKISELLLKIEDGVLDSNNPLGTTYMVATKHSEDLARIIAIAIVNREKDPPESLVRRIKHNFTCTDLVKCLEIVLQQMNITGFMRSIISVRGMNLLKMSPMDQRSQIASGVEHKEQ
jgi:hypothetical protein